GGADLPSGVKATKDLGGPSVTGGLVVTRLCLLPVLAASQNEVPAEPLEELAYRRSLRVALDVLNESTGLPQESPSREERTALCSREKPMELASLLCGPASSCVQEAVPGRSGPERKERVHPRLSGSPTCRKDPKCKVDHKKELRKSGGPQALVVPPARGGSRHGSGSRTCCASRTTPSKRGRSSAREPTVGQSAPSLSEGDDEESRLPAPHSPPTVKEEGLWAKGRDPSLPLPGPTGPPAPGHPACPDAQGLPAKRPCPDSGQRPPAARLEPGAVVSPRQGPGKCRALPGAARLHLPAPRASTEETGDLRVLVEEAKGLWPRMALCWQRADWGSPAVRAGPAPAPGVFLTRA
uniref:PWWP domain-containing DNA repair factor 3A-like n=1 Tax=Panthera onca TaxID=9690 RepID=UPI0029552941